MGELWGVFCEYVWENLQLYNSTALQQDIQCHTAMCRVEHRSVCKLIANTLYLTMSSRLTLRAVYHQFLIWPAMNISINTIDISELNCTFHMLASQLSCHEQSIVKSSAECKQSEWDTSSCDDCCFYHHSWIGWLCHVRNKIMFVLS